MRRADPRSTFWLAAIGGAFGLHRFYLGQSRLGVLYLLSFGVFGIGWMADAVRADAITDKRNAAVGFPRVGTTPAAGSRAAEPAAARRMPAPAIDINAVGLWGLETALGAGNEQLAQRVVAIRDARGGFTDVDDLTTAARLQSEERLLLGARVVFDTPRVLPVHRR